MAEYVGENTNEIIFPLGGIGTGSIGLCGNGAIKDFEIFNRPNKGSKLGYTHIAVKAVDSDGNLYTKVLNGDLLKDYVGQYSKSSFSGYGYGPSSQTMVGFPHFKKHTFVGEFPIAKIIFKDDDFPADVVLTAFNPFIPLDDKNSSIPAAFFEISFKNITYKTLKFSAAFSAVNNSAKSINEYKENGSIKAITLTDKQHKKSETDYSEICIATDCEDVSYQCSWCRGACQDSIATFWRDFASTKSLENRHYDEPSNDHATLCGTISINPEETKTIKFVYSWHVPNNYNYWNPFKDDKGKDIIWKNYYATVWKSAYCSAKYSILHYNKLYKNTLSFKNVLFLSTLDKSVIDAVSANLAVLKSPTVLRLQDGSFYGWEGVHEQEGSCEGSCTHVWSYAYALPFLFPQLERSMRNLDYKYNLLDNGQMPFRIPLPLGRKHEWDMPCVDGQMCGIIKTYRDWKISGDDEWLREIWPKAKQALEFAWNPNNPYKWDLDKDGVLEGRQHNTLDIELFGPSSWLEGLYIAALKAAEEISDYLGNHEDSANYRAIRENGQNWTEKNLFNGSFYIQKIDLKDKSIIDSFQPDAQKYWNEEAGEIKHQIGEGSEVDQLLAQWHANINGLGDIFDKTNRLTALKNLYKNNFKESYRSFYNSWRIFALNDESGTVICDYPDGTYKPTIPIPYCEESMNGFEYSAAGLMISEGFIDEGIRMVKGVRDRFNGKNRNPWNEFECGSNYARSMASYALIPIFSGFTFDMPHKTIGFNPLVNQNNFKSIWSVGCSWGSVSITDTKVIIRVLGGALNVNQIYLPFVKSPKKIISDGKVVDFKFNQSKVILPTDKISRKLEINYEK